MEAKDRWKEIKVLLENAGSELAALSEKAGAEFDHARVQAALARMDATDSMAEKISTWREQLMKERRAGLSAITRQLDQMLEGLDHVLVRFRN